MPVQEERAWYVIIPDQYMIIKYIIEISLCHNHTHILSFSLSFSLSPFLWNFINLSTRMAIFIYIYIFIFIFIYMAQERYINMCMCVRVCVCGIMCCKTRESLSSYFSRTLAKINRFSNILLKEMPVKSESHF